MQGRISVGSLGSVLEFDDPALLRAARVANVLHICGRVLATSTGTADNYGLSSRVERIDVFISHNWAVGQWRKFLLLAMHFNLSMACQRAIMALALTGSLTHVFAARGYLILATRVPFVTIVTMLVFFIALFFGHEAQVLCGFRDKRSVFLDKVCIHQGDPSLKERGILSLGAFLYKSDSMLVCFTGLYLKKLWTVYEFASFLLVRRETYLGAVHVMPPSLPMFSLAGSLVAFGGVVFARLLIILNQDAPVFKILIHVGLQCALIAISRWWAREQDEAHALFKDFAFANASYSAEADQALVRKNIIREMRHFAYVRTEASDDEALQAFDNFVRTAGLRAFLASVGHVGAPYRLLLPLQLTVLSDSVQWWSCCSTLGCPGHGTAAQIAFQMVGTITSAFIVVPLAVAMAFHLTRYCLCLRGAAGVAYCGAVGLLVTATLLVLDPISSPLRPWLMDAALQSVSSSFVFLLYCAALSTVTALVYRPPQRQGLRSYADVWRARRRERRQASPAEAAAGAPVVSPAAAQARTEVKEDEVCSNVLVSVASTDESEVAPHAPIVDNHELN